MSKAGSKRARLEMPLQVTLANSAPRVAEGIAHPITLPVASTVNRKCTIALLPLASAALGKSAERNQLPGLVNGLVRCL